MKKTVTYSVVGRVNPADRESGEVKYYAQSQVRGEKRCVSKFGRSENI